MTLQFGAEPALWAGLVGAIIAALVGFGVHVSPAQVGLINAVVTAGISVLVRANVSPCLLLPPAPVAS